MGSNKKIKKTVHSKNLLNLRNPELRFGVEHLELLYQSCLNYAPAVKTGLAEEVTILH